MHPINRLALFAAILAMIAMIYSSFRFKTLNENLRDTIEKYTMINRVAERPEPSTELLEKIKAMVAENRTLKARIAELESTSEQDEALKP